MVKYIIKKENDILYYNNGEWVSKIMQKNLIGIMQKIQQEN